MIISQFKILIVILNEVRNLAGCKALDCLQDLEILRYTQDDKKESREQNRVVILNEVKNLAGCKALTAYSLEIPRYTQDNKKE